MQATQSKNASEFLKLDLNSNPNSDPNSDPKLDATFTRSLPSPFTAPIQAARKYLERQRGDAWPHDSRLMQPRESRAEEHAASPPRDELLYQDSSTADQHGQAESSRERDRRLERSLYEGHSIEAGLSFEGVTEGEIRGVMNGAASVERAYLADGDGSEALFPYAAPGPLPNPAIVRGAISRLARESELRHESTRLPGREPGLGSQRAAAGDHEETKPIAAEKPVVSEMGKSMNFGDVARRVWGADAALPAVPNLRGARVLGLADIERDPRAGGVATAETELIEVGASSATMHRPAPIAEIILDRESVDVSEPPAVPSEYRFDGELALAHDACNLLSGLALYSELLGSPGVLGESYRHYAEELKLIAGRSQVLISRLLRVVAARKGQEFPAVALEPLALEPRARGLGENGLTDAVPATAHGDLMCDALATAHAPIAASSSATERPAEATSMVDLLMRWGSLLSTLAHGTIEMVFGPDAATPVPASAEALERILVNLVRNAKAATVQGGAIRIGVRLAEDGALEGSPDRASTKPESTAVAPGDQPSRIGAIPTMVLTVDDSGCGMTELQVQQLLGDGSGGDGGHGSGCALDSRPVISSGLSEPDPDRDEHLKQDQDSRQNPDQNRRQGLGFQIVRELVAATGGTLAVQSWPGRGTRVEIRWPAGPTPAAGDSTTEMQSQEAGRSAIAPALMQAEAQPASEPPSQIIERETLGKLTLPDAFSEVELHDMMLRLHRGGPQARSPLSRRLVDRRPPDTRQPKTRRPDTGQLDTGQLKTGESAVSQSYDRTAQMRAGDRGFGVEYSRALRSVDVAAGLNGAGPSSISQLDTTAKGAIAC